MYLAKHGLIIGFHGCDESFCDNIVNTRTIFNPSANNYDWLGNGMYFWENNRQRALEFAIELEGKERQNIELIKKPSVLGAVIDLGFCLDLLDAEYINMVKDNFILFEQTCKITGVAMPENKPLRGSSDLLLRRLDCAVIENLHEERINNNLRPFDTVRGVFIEGPTLYPN